MKKKKKRTPERKGELQLVWLVLILIVLSLIGMLCGCRSVKTVTVPVEVERTVLRTDTIRLHTHSIDTIVERDSVFMWQNGDTVTKEVTRWRYKVQLLKDTLWRVQTDSVYIEKPIKVEVEKKLSTWEQVKQKWGGWAVVILSILIIGSLLFVVKKVNKH